VTFTGFVPARASNVIGLAATYSQISADAIAFDRETVLFGTNPPASRSAITSSWARRPVSSCSRPGSACNSTRSISSIRAGTCSRRRARALVIKDETILGMRTQIKF
jgi:hypothetical protein